MNLELNTIHCCDCLDFMRGMPDKCVDLVLTSPPYDNLRDYKGYSFDFENIAKELLRILHDGGIVVWVVGDKTKDGSESLTSFKQALFFKEIGFNIHDTMIYGKNGFAFPELNRYQPIFEYMFILSKGKPKTFNPIKRKNNYGNIVKVEYERQIDGTIQTGKQRYILEDGNYGNIWVYDTGYMKTSKDKISYQHPATFPEQLASDHIKSWSNDGELVFDPFTGSGTTCKMAYQLGRNFIGTELSPEYCKIAEKRLRDARFTLLEPMG